MLQDVFSSAVFLAILSSFCVGLILILTQRLHGHLSLDGTAGVQKVHHKPTPRVGGLALTAGAVLGGFALDPGARALWWMICAAMLPAFLAGLLEDLTKKVNVKWRLVCTILSGAIFVLLTGYRIDHVDIAGPDWLLSFWLFSLCFTAFAIGGIANAINIIDGFHGLASGTALIVLAGFALIARHAGDEVLLACIGLSMASLAGFFVLNFPFGKIFLGDAGAYSIGYLLAVFAVALPARNADVSPIVGLIALAYPVTETMVSIWRRMRRAGTHPGMPDRLHLHSLVHRSLARRLACALNLPGMRNPLTSTILWVFPLLCAIFAVFGDESTPHILLWIALIVLLYLAVYRRVALLRPVLTPRPAE
jgi:UDP-N-acetylmuramyl pentapeptide phosphotransferase/UDP-N-acetylglucosamine-1-phosphate transferase